MYISYNPQMKNETQFNWTSPDQPRALLRAVGEENGKIQPLNSPSKLSTDPPDADAAKISPYASLKTLQNRKLGS